MTSPFLFRFHAFHASCHQVAEAERSQASASAAEHRARERLLAEQRRLSEALSISSALAQHLREASD